MKRRVFCLLFVFVLLLSGCSALLEREYLSVTPYVQITSDAGDEAILRAENYQDLVAVITYFVTEGSETGTIHLYSYTGNIDDDLTSACLQVSQDTPMGAYAVEYIKHTYSRIVSYYEAIISIAYRRTPAQIAAIIPVIGTSAIQEELLARLPAFPSELVFQVSYLNSDITAIESLVNEAYAATPAAALGLPSFSVSLYPASGTGKRIVELSFLWPEEPQVLREKYTAVTSAVSQLMERFVSGQQDEAALSAALHKALWSVASYSPDGGSTAYDALVLGTANSQGMTLAYEALCAGAGLSFSPVEGYLYNDPWFWCIVSFQDDCWHVNPAQSEFTLYTDSQMVDKGFAWNQENYPACGNDETGG